jgi:hypothetical protein
MVKPPQLETQVNRLVRALKLNDVLVDGLTTDEDGEGAVVVPGLVSISDDGET